MAKLTPMMEQYFAIKEQYQYCLLFFRLGDFYEMFYDDAKIASRELDLTLTGKSCGQEERAPMCGIPYHSADGYIARLVEKGYKVAICEQVEDPRTCKGIVKREVIRVITPGTIIDNSALDETKNNYIASVYCDQKGFGLAICDVSTGEFLTTQFSNLSSGNRLVDEVMKYQPAELVANEGFLQTEPARQMESRLGVRPEGCGDWMFRQNEAVKRLCRHFGTSSVDGLGLKDQPFALCASGALLEYLYQTQKSELHHVQKLKVYQSGHYMALDASSRRNLELTQNMREKGKKGTLLWVLDQTKTAMGARMMRKWLEQPLLEVSDIQKRLDAVEEMKAELFLREEVKELLSPMLDMERLFSKAVYQTANARDLLALKNSLGQLPALKEALSNSQSAYLRQLKEQLDTMPDLFSLLDASINEKDTPFTVREGNLIKEGFHQELDTLFHAEKEGGHWIEQLEEREREETGIKNLKVRYNKVFGYYIEVTKSNLASVPERYMRKQTLASCERFTTTELSDLADLLLGASEKKVELEYQLFCEIRDKVAQEVERLQRSADAVATIDVLQSLAEVAERQGYVKPTITNDGVLSIHQGRHPVVEKMRKEAFIPNDTYLDLEENRLAIITGPNMAGKSTYMRQTALIVLMAQMGSFVPASEAQIGVVDRIFTRVGASDDLASGQSTFMLEMVEVANILNNATNKSLLILDEIGRGTSTFDGLSIAWSVLEYIEDKKLVGAKTLFATHYHELTELEGKLSGVKNYCITVQEKGDEVIFLRKIVRGGADHSYGIQVGQLAGLPYKVIRRAKEILRQLNAADVTKKAKKLAKEAQQTEETAQQVDLFTAKDTYLADELLKLDVNNMTPLQAAQALCELQAKAKGL